VSHEQPGPALQAYRACDQTYGGCNQPRVGKDSNLNLIE
jgi:hypothetical protein